MMNSDTTETAARYIMSFVIWCLIAASLGVQKYDVAVLLYIAMQCISIKYRLMKMRGEL